MCNTVFIPLYVIKTFIITCRCLFHSSFTTVYLLTWQTAPLCFPIIQNKTQMQVIATSYQVTKSVGAKGDFGHFQSLEQCTDNCI